MVYIDLKISDNALNKDLRFIMCQRKYGPRHCIRMNYTASEKQGCERGCERKERIGEGRKEGGRR